MKKFILIIIFLFFSFNLFSLPSVTNIFSKTAGSGQSTNIFGSVCIDGYRFAFMNSYGNNGVALVQIFRKSKAGSLAAGSEDSKPQPMRCK